MCPFILPRYEGLENVLFEHTQVLLRALKSLSYTVVSAHVFIVS